MEGRKEPRAFFRFLTSGIGLRLLAAFALLVSTATLVRGQAMGKAQIDLPPAAATSEAAPVADAANLHDPVAVPQTVKQNTASAPVAATLASPTPAAAPQDSSAPRIQEQAVPAAASVPADAPKADGLKADSAKPSAAAVSAPSAPSAADPLPAAIQRALPAIPDQLPPAPKPAPTQLTASPTPASPIESQPIRPRNADSAAAPAAAAAPNATNSSSFLPSGLSNLGQVGAALAIVIGLILIGRALVRRFVPGAKASSGKGVIEILARHPLSKTQSLVLVRIGSQIVALNQGKDASQSVLVISDAAEVAKIIGQIEGKNPHSSQAGFNKLLANARIDLEETAEDPEIRDMNPNALDEQLEEMAAAKRQLMELRQHVRSVRDSLPRS